ncbi:hypothetical protein Mapa_004689 [Marchantia paleacea]|nr:hypothetical protein Mapa_004689 [Marchantia paleacea]
MDLYTTFKIDLNYSHKDACQKLLLTWYLSAIKYASSAFKLATSCLYFVIFASTFS